MTRGVKGLNQENKMLNLDVCNLVACINIIMYRM